MTKDYQGALQGLYDSITMAFSSSVTISDDEVRLRTSNVKLLATEIQHLLKHNYVKIMKGSEKHDLFAVQKKKAFSPWEVFLGLFRAKQRV